MRFRAIPAAWLLVSAAAFAQDLDEQSYDRYKREILPSRQECLWEEIDWHQTLWSAAVEAQEKRKPILLFTMNGHPCGHT